jgi:hypothetical protein
MKIITKQCIDGAFVEFQGHKIVDIVEPTNVR